MVFYRTKCYGFKKATIKKKRDFTLAHELGRYLLNREHIDKNIFNANIDLEERWCNNFAFHLVANDETNELKNITKDDINITNKKY
ncbi:ImmA/IrrE family metallo-endopeptidase [Helicobacter trogontum]|uniref:Uncharacterized protein n=1 Tax=Helicobacter trogontum TaxID=50960 RepID=A0A4U8T3T1_9HELI|nr:hypothetical protein [Helicobacter trogontum]MDY5186053.1 hypothetical protein [Helicobacter trogontum]TLD94063.1 hypothetical protein LS80_010445 [Helicobacter trogontum]